MLRALFSILLLILLTLPAAARLIISPVTDSPPSCREMDLNEDPQSPLHKIPIYDQDGSGLCYAYAASQMIDYYRLQHGDKSYDLTNPVYASWATYYKNPSYFKSSTLDGGDGPKVVAALKQQGMCTNRDVQKQLRQLSSTASDSEILEFLDIVYKNHGGWFFNEDWETTSEEVTKKIGISCQQQDSLKAVLQKKDFFSLAPTEVLSKMFKDCAAKPVNVPELEAYSFGDDKAMKDQLDKALAKKLPAQVDLCSGFFEDPSFRGLRGWSPPLFRSSNGNSKKGCGAHAVVVTGRLNINGSCHYLIRNSWGSYWKPEGATACACKTRSGAYKQICNDPKEVAEYVGCWFDQKTMLPNTGGVNVFK